MPFTDPPDTILASLTDEGRSNLARVALGEISFVLKGFAVGREGYNDTNPVKVDLINTSSPILGDHFFPAAGARKALESIENPTPATVVANCRLDDPEAIAGLGEVGLWSEIAFSSVNPGEVGNEFLFAVAHFPLSTKTLRQVVVYRIIIQF